MRVRVFALIPTVQSRPESATVTAAGETPARFATSAREMLRRDEIIGYSNLDNSNY